MMYTLPQKKGNFKKLAFLMGKSVFKAPCNANPEMLLNQHTFSTNHSTEITSRTFAFNNFLPGPTTDIQQYNRKRRSIK